MSTLYNPELPVLVKLGSIAVHVEEMLSDDGHAFDREAIRTLLAQPDLQHWLNGMKTMCLMPVKRK